MAHIADCEHSDNRKRALLFLLSSSSSSSEDEEISEIVLQCSTKKNIPKIKGFIETIHEFDNEEFRKNFRLNKETAQYLIDEFRKSDFFNKVTTRGGRPRVSAEIHVLSFLWFAGNKSTMREIEKMFDMTKSSFHRIMSRVMNFLLDIGDSVIRMPSTEEEKEKLEAEFRKVSGFPGVLGCIDGTSIAIRTPANKIKSTYTNRHDIPAMTLQGICDNKKRFIHVFTGTPAKIHDARVYKISDISKDLPRICGDKYHILGDGGYFIRPWLLVPFKDYGNLTQAQLNFNTKFSATRVSIENSFGILKGRWRQLLKLDMKGVFKMTQFIISCCVLHNLCIDCDDYFQTVVEEEAFEEEPFGEDEWQLRTAGENKRNAIMNILPYQ